MTGKKITSRKIIDEKIDITNFTPGLYILEIANAAGTINHIKIVVQ